MEKEEEEGKRKTERKKVHQENMEDQINIVKSAEVEIPQIRKWT